jgi:hypothetical protein
MSAVESKDVVNFIRAEEDGHLFYYVAARPSFAVNNNTPDIQFEVFRLSTSTSDQYVAQLQIQCELNSSLQAAHAAAKANPNIPNDALLQPLQPLSSTATLGLPGIIQQTAPQPTALGNQQLCVLQAGFDTTPEIEQLTSFLRTPNSCPISIIYKLTYLQTLPPAQFELTANWSQVYQYLKTNIGFNALIFSIDIEHVTETLLSHKIVEIKTRDTNPNGYITLAGQELAQILLTEFFTPALPKINVNSAQQLGFYLQEVSIESVEKRSLSAQLNETSVVQRSIFPQALFSQLIGESHYDSDKVIRQTSVHDDFFSHRTVAISLLTEHLDPGIALVQLNMTYGDTCTSLLFTPSDLASKHFRAPSKINPKTGKMIWPVSYQFTVHFSQAVGGSFSIESARMETDLNQVYLDVASLYTHYLFQISAVPTFNWTWYNNVVVTISYAPLNNPEAIQSRAFQLTQEHQADQYEVLISDPSQYQFSVIKNYTAKDNSPHLSASLETPANQNVFLYSPTYAQRTLIITATMDWPNIKQTLVIARYYYDKSNPELALQQRLLFTAQTTESQIFSADQLDPELRTVELTVFITDLQDKTQQYTRSTDQNQINLTH